MKRCVGLLGSSLLLCQVALGQVSESDQTSLPAIHDLLIQSDAMGLEHLRRLQHLQYVQITRKSSSRDESETPEERAWIGYCVAGVPLKRMVLKNNSPLTAEEQKEVDHSAANVIRREKKSTEDALKNKSGKDNVSATKLEGAGAFTRERRIMLDGRATIAVDYTGNPQAHVSGMIEKLMSHIQGTLFFDEEDRALRKVLVTTPDDASLGLMMKVKKGMQAEISYSRASPGKWEEDHFSFRGEAKLLFFSATGNEEEWDAAFEEQPCFAKDPYQNLAFWQLPQHLQKEIRSLTERANKKDQYAPADIERMP